jgi:Flp pilus assembly protein CpaB
MDAVNQRPGSPPKKKRANADSLKHFVSTRRGAYTVAAVAATLAGLVLLVFIDRYKEDVNAGIEPAPVLTADRLIPAGTAAAEVITNKLFKPSAVAEENIRPGAVTQASQLVGTVAVRDILPGQQITVGDFAAAADPIRSRLSKRERAVQIPVDRINGMLNLVHQGDRVDIVATYDKANADTPGTQTKTLQLIARDMRIMSNGGSTVILEADDREAAALAFAATNGELWFLLRPPVGATDGKPYKITQETLNNLLVTGTPQTEDESAAVAGGGSE